MKKITKKLTHKSQFKKQSQKVLLAFLLAFIFCSIFGGKANAAYRDTIEADTPIYYWPMDESAGATSLTAAVGGTAINLTGATAGASGQVDGTAVSFNGISNFGQTASSLNLTAYNKIVVEALMYIPSYNSTGKIAWEFNTSVSASNDTFYYGVDGGVSGSEPLANIALKGNVNYSIATYTRPTAGNWHHVVTVYNTGLSINEVDFYIDGVLQTPAGRPYNGNNTNTFGNRILYLMARAGTSQFLNGKMQHLAIYSDLSESAITAHSSAAFAPASLSAGTLSETSHSTNTATVSWTAGSGGTAPITTQLQKSSHGAGIWSNVSGATVSPVTDSGLTPATAYDYQVVYTDAALATATSNTITITTDAIPSAATAITLSGPSSGSKTTSSTNFTVGSNGSVTGSVVVTPSDNGAGGTFSPINVTLTTTSTATFTYTPSSFGTKTISVTNNGGLTNPSTINYSVIGSGLALGDSTAAAYAGQNSVTSYLYTSDQLSNGWTVNDVAVPGHTIAQQKTVYLSTASRSTVDYTIAEVGLNDLNPAEASSVAIARLQNLVDTINANKKVGSLTIISTMTPARQRLIDVYGAINGPLSYQKWLDMNNAIKGLGSTPITGVDYRISNHTPLLDDGMGNLAAIYDTGDHIHENNAARQIIARVWRDSLAELGLLNPDVPSAPIIGTATAGDSSASVTFSPSQFNGGATITSYTAISSPGNFTGSGSNSPITIEGLSGGISYAFTVTANNAVGASDSSSTSNSVTVTDLTPPTISITFPISGDTVSADDTITFTDSEETDPQCSLDNTNWNNCISGITNFSELTGWNLIDEKGTFILYVKDIDSVGNIGTDQVENLIKSDTQAPVRSSGSPSVELASDTTQTTISITTNEAVICKYSTTSGISYVDMISELETTNGTTHTKNISNLSSGNSYSYYVRCRDTAGNTNDTDYLINFSIANETNDDTDDEKDLNIHSIKAEPTENTITITWKTDHSTKATVRYGRNKNLEEKKKDNDKEKKHKVVLENLQSNTKYYFRIKVTDSDDNEDSSKIHSVMTKPVPVSVTNSNSNSNQSVSIENSTENQSMPESSENITPSTCSYAVQQGDTLWGIAKQIYGDPTQYKKITDLNHDLNTDTLKIGQKLKLCDNNQAQENSQNDFNSENSDQQTQNQPQSQIETQIQPENKTFHWWNPFSWF